jgi:hypothetical protein
MRMGQQGGTLWWKGALTQPETTGSVAEGPAGFAGSRFDAPFPAMEIDNEDRVFARL